MAETTTRSKSKMVFIPDFDFPSYKQKVNIVTPKENISYYDDIFRIKKGGGGVSLSFQPKVEEEVSKRDSTKLRFYNSETQKVKNVNSMVFQPQKSFKVVKPLRSRIPRIRRYENTIKEGSIEGVLSSFRDNATNQIQKARIAVSKSTGEERQVAQWKLEELLYTKEKMDEYFGSVIKKTNEMESKIASWESERNEKVNELNIQIQQLDELVTRGEDVKVIQLRMKNLLGEIAQKNDLIKTQNSEMETFSSTSLNEFGKNYNTWMNEAHTGTLDKLNKLMDDIENSTDRSSLETWEKFRKYIIQSPDAMSLTEITRSIYLIKSNEVELKELKNRIGELELQAELSMGDGTKFLNQLRKEARKNQKLTDILNEERIKYQNLNKQYALLKNKEIELENANNEISKLKEELETARVNSDTISSTIGEKSEEIKKLEEVLGKLKNIKSDAVLKNLDGIISEFSGAGLQEVSNAMKTVKEKLSEYENANKSLQEERSIKERELTKLREELVKTNERIKTNLSAEELVDQLQNINLDETKKIYDKIGVVPKTKVDEVVKDLQKKISGLEKEKKETLDYIAEIRRQMKLKANNTENLIQLIEEIKNANDTSMLALNNKMKNITSDMIRQVELITNLKIEEPIYKDVESYFAGVVPEIMDAIKGRISMIESNSEGEKKTISQDISSLLLSYNKLYPDAKVDSLEMLQAAMETKAKKDKEDKRIQEELDRTRGEEAKRVDKVYREITKVIIGQGLARSEKEVTPDMISALIASTRKTDQDKIKEMERQLSESIRKISLLELGSKDDADKNADIIRKLQKDLDDANDRIAGFGTLSSQQEAMRRSLETDLNKLKTQISDLAKENENLKKNSKDSENEDLKKQLDSLRKDIETLTKEKTDWIEANKLLRKELDSNKNSEEIKKLKERIRENEGKLKAAELKSENSIKVLQQIGEKLKLNESLVAKLTAKVGTELEKIEDAEELKPILESISLFRSENQVLKSILSENFGTELQVWDKVNIEYYKEFLNERFGEHTVEEFQELLTNMYIPFNKNGVLDFEDALPMVKSGGAYKILEENVSDTYSKIINDKIGGASLNTLSPQKYDEVLKNIAISMTQVALARDSFSSILKGNAIGSDVSEDRQELINKFQLVGILQTISNSNVLDNLKSGEFWKSFNSILEKAEDWTSAGKKYKNLLETSRVGVSLDPLIKSIDDAYNELKLGKKDSKLPIVAKLQALIESNMVTFSKDTKGDMVITLGTKKEQLSKANIDSVYRKIQSVNIEGVNLK